MLYYLRVSVPSRGSKYVNSDTVRPKVNVDIGGVGWNLSQNQPCLPSLCVKPNGNGSHFLHCDLTYMGSDVSLGILDREIIFSSLATLSTKDALKCGSSKQGNTLLAKLGLK